MNSKITYDNFKCLVDKNKDLIKHSIISYEQVLTCYKNEIDKKVSDIYGHIAEKLEMLEVFADVYTISVYSNNIPDYVTSLSFMNNLYYDLDIYIREVLNLDVVASEISRSGNYGYIVKFGVDFTRPNRKNIICLKIRYGFIKWFDSLW